MKKKSILMALVVAMVMGGCGQKAPSANNQSPASEQITSSENMEGDSQETSEASESIEGEESSETKESSEITESTEEKEASETVEPSESPEDEIIAMKNYLRELKSLHNLNELDFEPTISDFCTMDEEGLNVIMTPEGELYGFYDDMTQGCSVWCAVNDYKVEAKASSTLPAQGKQSYDVANILSGNRNDGWVEGVEGDGVGEQIEIKKTYEVALGEEYDEEESIFFYELCIVNGLTRNEKSWKENGRVKALDFYYCGNLCGTLELEDTMKPQFISLSGLNLAARNKEEVTFTFVIKEVYPGEKYQDTALTGIEIAFDTPNH